MLYNRLCVFNSGLCSSEACNRNAERRAGYVGHTCLVEEFHRIYNKYPKYPVADAGYGSYNNYLYCEEHGMEKYMKFTMYEKTIKNAAYREDPFRAVNFKRNEAGQLVCPNGKAFTHYADRPIRGNEYGRTEELHICSDCTNCPYRQQCYKGKGDRRVIRLNRDEYMTYDSLRGNNYFRLEQNPLFENDMTYLLATASFRTDLPRTGVYKVLIDSVRPIDMIFGGAQ